MEIKELKRLDKDSRNFLEIIFQASVKKSLLMQPHNLHFSAFE